jgi:hypothetical protein
MRKAVWAPTLSFALLLPKTIGVTSLNLAKANPAPLFSFPTDNLGLSQIHTVSIIVLASVIVGGLGLVAYHKKRGRGINL